MALRWLESFDHADAATYGDKYQEWNGTITTGRTGNGSKTSGNAVVFRRTFDAAAQTWIVGLAWKCTPALASNSILEIRDGASVQIKLKMDAGQAKILVYRGNFTLLGTVPKILSPGVWYYIECKVTIDNSAGALEVRIDGTSELTLTGVDTQDTGNASADAIAIGGHASFVFDDVYICDGTGSANNDFLGDVKVMPYRPNGAGTYSQWTPTAGANYECVDEPTPNEDTDYNSTDTAGNRDSYAFEDAPTSGYSIVGIQINERVRKDDALSHNVQPFIRRGTTDYDLASEAVPSSYAYVCRVQETDPSTSALWTAAGFNAAEFGIYLAT